jgi:hypothetical protein
MKKIIIIFALLISSISVTNASEVNTYIKGMTTGTDKIEVIIVGETHTCYKVSRHGNVYFIKKDNIKLSETSKELLKSNEVNKLFNYGMNVSKSSNKVSVEKQILSDLMLSNISVK